MSNIEKIKELRDKLKEAEAVHCRCSDFVLQYEGCSCGKYKGILEARKELDKAIEDL